MDERDTQRTSPSLEPDGAADPLADEFPEVAAQQAAWQRPGDARLYGDLREQTRILALLHDVSQELTAILDSDRLMQAIAERVREIVPFDLFSVMLINQQTQRLEHTFSLRYDERVHLRTTLPLGEGLCGTAAQTRRAVRVGRVQNDPRYIRGEGGLAVGSEITVPLIAKGKVLGVFDLESMQEDAFTEQHERMLVTIASPVAIALENARLYEQVVAAERRLAEDLEHAREVQRALLPASTPCVPGLEVAVRWEPARELGGDFYDFLPYPDGRLGIAVGDVSGKGSAAALLGSLGMGMLREHATQHACPPDEVLKHVNQRLHLAGGEGRFIALSFAVYDPATRDLCIASAGFPKPLHVRGRKPETIHLTGIPLGLLPEAEYEMRCVRLEPGDAVIFCSDGIIEQTNAREEELGMAGLVARLAASGTCDSAEVIAENILNAAKEHGGAQADCGDCSDDRTIVVLRVRA